jgi:hypothetical protein
MRFTGISITALVFPRVISGGFDFDLYSHQGLLWLSYIV